MRKEAAIFTSVILSLALSSCSITGKIRNAYTKESQETSRVSETEDPVETTTQETEKTDYEICSSTDEKDVIDYLQNAVDNHWEYVALNSDLDFDFIYLRSLDYGAFWVSSFAETERLDNGCTEYQIFYDEEEVAHMEEMKSEMDSSVDQIISQIPADADEWEICRIVHDELIKMTSDGIDSNDRHIKDAYGPLGMKMATCVGYSSAFRMILMRLGIPCRIVCSDTHSWIWMGDDPSCGYIDIYWDDDDYIDNMDNEVIRYTYFGMTSEELQRISLHELVNVGPTAGEPDIVFESYYEHEGYVLDEFSFDGFNDMAKEQYDDGKSALEVKFTDWETYIKYKDYYSSEANRQKLIKKLNYDGKSYILCSDEEGIYVYTIFVNVMNIQE